MSFTYRGSSGETIPMPSVEEKTQRPRIGKTFFIIGVIEDYKTLW
jgi:hypothetical protein